MAPPKLRKIVERQCPNCNAKFLAVWKPARHGKKFCTRRCASTFNKNLPPPKHGEGATGKLGRTWISWHNMLQRCNDPNAPNYPRYGGRGIVICDRWRGPDGFLNFKADMGERPQCKTLDRWPNIDGNYEPSNCRWATPKEQSANRRNSRGVAVTCKYGHPITPENTYIFPKTRREVCKPCKLRRWREGYQRKILAATSSAAEGRRA